MWSILCKGFVLLAFDLFLLPCEGFIKNFEGLKSRLGNDYVNKIGENFSLIDIMYED